MKKKLIALLLSGILGIIPAGAASAEELSSGDETIVFLDETADAAFENMILSEEVTSPQEEIPTVDEIPATEKTVPEEALSAGDAENDLLESGEELPSAGAAYSGTWGTCNWDINSEGVLTIHAGTGADNQKQYSVWEEYNEIINSVTTEKGVVFPEDSSGLFCLLYKCTSIDLSMADTSKVTDMTDMFAGCNSLTDLNISTFDTSNVTSMAWMFDCCMSLNSLDLSNFNTSKVTQMWGMFNYCISLNSLNISNFDTSKVTDMSNIFTGFRSLLQIKVGSGFSFSGDGSSTAYLPGSAWHSAAAGKSFSTSEISETRNHIADIYTLLQLQVTGSRNYDYAYQVLTLVNNERKAQGLNALKMDRSLLESAMVRAAEITYSFSHERPDGTTCFSINEKMNGENIAYGQWSPAAVMDGWMNSAGHRANILRQSFKSIGVGCFEMNGTLYWVQCFGINEAEAVGNIPSNTEVDQKINLSSSTESKAPSQQPKLVAAYNGAKGIGLKFYKVDHATDYVLYRKFNGVWSRVCTFSAADPGLQISGDTIMYTDASVAKDYGKGYIYSVSAKNIFQETTYDTKGSAIYRLTPPALTGASNSSAGTATVSWKGVFGRTETNGTYDLQYAEYKDGQAGTFKSVTKLPGYNNLTLKTTVSGLKKGSQYVFRIRCAKTNKDRGTYYSEYSKWLSVTITK